MFRQGKKAPGAAQARGSGRSAVPGLSFIGPDVVVSGDVASSGQVHIDGRVDGAVRCETLIQGKDGIIAGDIVADAAHLSGLVDGTVWARLVTLEPSARITGDLTYETLSIAAGAAIEGRLARREGSGRQEPAPLALASSSESALPKKRLAAKPDEPTLLPVPDLPAKSAAAG